MLTFLVLIVIAALALMAWAETARVTTTVAHVGGNNGSGSITLGGTAYNVSAENCTSFSLPIGASQTDYEIDMAFAYANLSAIIIVVDQDMTLQTNDGTTPDDEFSLKANVPFAWDSDSGIPNPFTANVTSIFLTNTTAGTFKAFVFLSDVT